MNSWQNMNYASRFTGDAYAFLLPGTFSSETSVANKVSNSTADQVFSSQDGFMNAVPLISFFDCATVPAGPYFTVLSAGSDGADHVAGNTILQHIVRSFTRWITVTAKALRRLVCRGGADLSDRSDLSDLPGQGAFLCGRAAVMSFRTFAQ